MKDYRKSNRRVYSLKMHVNICVKYRIKCITEEVFCSIAEGLYICHEKWQITCETLNHDGDHIHMVIDYPQELTASDAVGRIKSITSKVVWRNCEEEMLLAFRGKRVFWSAGAFFRSIGDGDIEDVREYIKNQGEEE